MKGHVETWTKRLGTVPAASVTYATLETVAQEWWRAGSSAATINRRMAGYMADPAEIASAGLFLASADARYITGIELTVDGGLSQI